MKRLVILFCIFYYINYGYGQSSCPKTFIEAKYKIENCETNVCDLSQDFTLIGMNKEALIEEDKFFEDGDMGLGDPKCLIEKDSNLKILPAINYFYRMLEKNDFVILNECHNYPQNRVFFYNILDSIKYFGFNSLFIETLSYAPNDSLYRYTKGIERWGYYTIENIFRQISYKLGRSDYSLYSYEVYYPRKIDTLRRNDTTYFINKSDVKWLPIKADSLLLANFFSPNDNIQREAEQALNIYQKILRNRLKKAFIYCGYTHAFKSNVYMAGMLKYLLHKDVYTIDQTYLREHSDVKYENSLYTKYANVEYPFVITNKKNIPVHTIKRQSKNYITDTLFDLTIAAPRSIYINNRPTWLELNGERKRYNLKKFIQITELEDFLVAVYNDDENEEQASSTNRNEQVPVDIFQVKGKGDNYDLILRPNRKYRLKLIKNSEIKIDKIINIP